MKNKYLDILDSLDNNPSSPHNLNSNILIVDAMNLFMRSFSAINHINVHGNHIGGLTGFLKGLGWYIRLHKPTRVIIVFDGEGNSNTKKMIDSDYKSNRSNLKLVKKHLFETKTEELTSINNQLDHLVTYLSLLPVTLISIDKVEADDVIAFISSNFKLISSNITIVSADNDFYQLIDDKITVFNPLLKKHFYKTQVKEKYNIYPENYLLYKTLIGDKGDNVSKVKGLGEKKIPKLFNFLLEDKKYTLEDIFDHCEKNKDNHIIYQNLLNNKNQIKINKELMDLSNPKIMDNDIEFILETLNNGKLQFNVFEFKKLYINDKLQDSIKNLDLWLTETFNSLYSFSLKK